MLNLIIEFWTRNRYTIFAIFGFLLVVNMCGRIFMPAAQSDQFTYEEFNNGQTDDPNMLRSYDALMQEKISEHGKNDSSFFTFVLLLTALFLIAQYAHRKGWFDGLLPRWISLKTRFERSTNSGRLLMRITIHNNTRESKTFLTPQLFFKKRGQTRNFLIKNEDFPLTLTPGTGHSMLIDVDLFYEKVKDLKGFGRIGAMIQTSFGESYFSRAYPKWLVFKKG
jgi:hypothetical protein